MCFCLQERSGNNSFTHNALSLKYKLDNEFELVFVVSECSFSFVSANNVMIRSVGVPWLNCPRA